MPSIDTFLGLCGLGVAVFAIIDNRRQRKEREKAVIAARAVIDRIYGLLIGIKPGVPPNFETTINDGLSAINQERTKLDKL